MPFPLKKKSPFPFAAKSKAAKPLPNAPLPKAPLAGPKAKSNALASK